jgi:hypothetical protein
MEPEGLVRYTCGACGKSTLDYPIDRNDVSDGDRSRKYEEWCDYCGWHCNRCGQMTGRKQLCSSCQVSEDEHSQAS